MTAMMLGSMIFSTVELRSERDVGRMLLSILALAAVSLLLPVLVRAEMITFWSFALFEMCVGLYFPTMGRLKSELVDDATRGKVYALMRLPLNVFVVLALGMTQEGMLPQFDGVIGSQILTACRRRSSRQNLHGNWRPPAGRVLRSPEVAVVIREDSRQPICSAVSIAGPWISPAGVPFQRVCTL